MVSLTSGIYEKSNAVLAGYFFEMIKPGSDKHYMIILNRTKPIGNVSLARKNKKTFEIHIVIGEKKYWGEGFGREAIRSALQNAFNKLGYRNAYLEVRLDNERAIKAYQSLGFEKKGLKKYPKNKFQPVVLKMILNKVDFLLCQQAKKITALLLSKKNVILVGPSDSGKTWFIKNVVIPLLTAKKIKVGYFSDCNQIQTNNSLAYQYVVVDEVEILKDRKYLESLHPDETPYYSVKYIKKVNGWHADLKKIKQSGLFVVSREKKAMNNFTKNIKRLDWNKKIATVIKFVPYYKITKKVRTDFLKSYTHDLRPTIPKPK